MYFVKLKFARAMSHAGQWLNTARRVLAHVRAYLDSGQYGERRDTERREALRCVGMARLRKTEFCACLTLFLYIP